MVGADAASPQPTRPSAASIRTKRFSAVTMVIPDIFIGVLSGSATGMASTRRISSGACAAAPLAFACGRSNMEHSLYLEPRVEIVAQAVAEQVEGEHREADGEPREQDHPGRLAVEVGG